MRQSIKHLITCVTLGFYGLVAYSTPFAVNGIYYDIDASNNAYVTYDPSGNKYRGSEYEIPSTVKNEEGKEFTVVAIGKKAFYGNPNLSIIKLPETLTSIEESAFYDCDNLKRIGTDPRNSEENKLPDAIKSIGNSAFSFCPDLNKLTLSSSLTSIGRSVFSYSGIVSIIIPKNVSSIAKSAFANCEKLASMSVEVGNPMYDSRNGCNAIIQTQGNILVAGCVNTIIPNDIITIGENAFYGSKFGDTGNVVLPQSLKSIEGSAFYSCSLKVVDLPNSVESIGDNAFSFCSDLTSVKLSSSLLTIGRSAFSYTKLEGIIIPKSVLTIGKNAFSNCENLSKIQVEDGSIFYSSPDNCNAILQSSKLIVGCSGTTIPQSAIYIGEGAFYGSGISGELKIPSTIKAIEEQGFYGCEYLTSIIIEEGLTTIGRYAFSFCTKLKKMYLPSTIKSIDRYAFHYCDKITDIYTLLSNPFAIDNSVFDDEHYDTATLHVPAGTLPLYEQAGGWKEFKNKVDDAVSGIASPIIALQRIYSANGILYIESSTDGNCAIYSMSGQLIRKLALKKGTNTVNGLTKGVYIINGNKVLVK